MTHPPTYEALEAFHVSTLDFSKVPSGLQLTLHLISGTTRVVTRGTDTPDDIRNGLVRFFEPKFNTNNVPARWVLLMPSAILGLEFIA
jgi:hypothetical protein